MSHIISVWQSRADGVGCRKTSKKSKKVTNLVNKPTARKGGDITEDVSIVSKYGGYPEDEDQTLERAAALAATTPRPKPKVFFYLSSDLLG